MAGRDMDALDKDKSEHCRDPNHHHTHLQQTVIDSVAEDSATSSASTYDCPVCRKAQLLDLDRLQVSLSYNAVHGLGPREKRLADSCNLCDRNLVHLHGRNKVLCRTPLVDKWPVTVFSITRTAASMDIIMPCHLSSPHLHGLLHSVDR